jgi:hypothetical protein
MKIFAVRIGEKYGIEYERYLEKKLPYEIIWIREPYHPEVTLQWNKCSQCKVILMSRCA